MEIIFTTEALLACSLMGDIATNTGAGNYFRRTALDLNAFVAIQGWTNVLMLSTSTTSIEALHKYSIVSEFS